MNERETDGAIERRLRAWLAAEAPPSAPDELRRAVAAIPATVPAARAGWLSVVLGWRPAGIPQPAWLLLVAALLLALVGSTTFIGARLLEGRLFPPRDPNALVPTAVPSPLPSPSPSVAPTAAPGVGLAWQWVDDPDLVSSPRNGSMYGVISGGPGAIAWGYVDGTGPRIWTTTDGLDWKAASVEAATDADPAMHNPGEVLDITAGGPGYVAVGSYLRAGGDGITAMVWTSVDGMAWQRVADDPSFATSTMADVVSWKGELLAFGCANSPEECTDPRVWASSDGLTWSVIELSLPAGIDGVGLPVVSADRLWGVWVGPDGASSRLTSTDGRKWVVADLPVLRQPTITPLYALPDGLYTTVAPWPLPSKDFTPPPKPAGQPAVGVYRSIDLATWKLLSEGLPTVGRDLIVVGDTLVMVGATEGGRPMGWRSVDGGLTWQAVPADRTGGTMLAVASLPDGTLVAVGGTSGSTTAAWVSQPVRP